MNSTLKQLAHQSGITVNAELEKFAELLVKECITVARGADGLDATHEAWYLIKQHFGVE